MTSRERHARERLAIEGAEISVSRETMRQGEWVSAVLGNEALRLVMAKEATADA